MLRHKKKATEEAGKRPSQSLNIDFHFTAVESSQVMRIAELGVAKQ